MPFLMASFVFGFVLPLAALILAIRAYRMARRPPATPRLEERVGSLEAEVRALLHRVRTLEGGADADAAAPQSARLPAIDSATGIESGVPVDPVGGADVDAAPLGGEVAPPPIAPTMMEPVPLTPAAASHVEAAPPPFQPAPPAAIDLEQRIGARWATWVGIVALLIAASLFLKWSLDSDVLGPAARVVLGLVGGLALVSLGLALHRRRDVPYLSEGLAGLGLGVLYLSLWAAHALYGLLGAAGAFASMLAVTLLGSAVSVVSSRQITAALAVLGGLLTPVLLSVQRPDERNLLVYLIALDFLVLAVARFRSWPSLNRLAWAGSALLVALAFVRQPDAVNPLSRLVLLSGLFLLFLAVPLLRERATYRRIGEIDLVLVVGNAAGYFWVTYVTLESWHPAATAPYAVALALVYRAAAADYAARVPDDQPTVALHEGIAWTFLTIAIPLAVDGPWVTLGWAIQGVVLLAMARRMATPVAAWGGLAALLLASLRVAVLDRYWYPDATPVWNITYLVHLVVVVALVAGGWLGGRLRSDGATASIRPWLRSVLWVVAALVLAVLFWREPGGLWPATLLTVLVLVLGGLARLSSSPAFAIAIPVVGAILLARVLGADDGLARAAAQSLVNRPLLSRAVACLALIAAGAALARSTWSAGRGLGRIVAATAAVALLFALSVNWTRYQDWDWALTRGPGAAAAADARWRTQVGLSALWALYAALALLWGFVRSAPAVRYGALSLLGLTAAKVFLVDLSAVRTVYRITSFVILGVVLLLVSLLYQKARKPPSAIPVGPAQR